MISNGIKVNENRVKSIPIIKDKVLCGKYLTVVRRIYSWNRLIILKYAWKLDIPIIIDRTVIKKVPAKRILAHKSLMFEFESESEGFVSVDFLKHSFLSELSS